MFSAICGKKTAQRPEFGCLGDNGLTVLLVDIVFTVIRIIKMALTIIHETK